MVDPFREIWRPHRYKVYYGGRGSGKVGRWHRL